MSDHYDHLENRTSAARESMLFRDLRHVLKVSKPRVPALRAQLKGIDIATLTSRVDLAKIPIVRRADIVASQSEAPPLGGATATRLANLHQAFLGPDLIGSVEGHAKDWWGLGRALFAAGLRKGMLVLNCFSYDLVPDGHMFASGAFAVGCPVIPAGNASLTTTSAAALRYRPAFFCGVASRLRELLDHVGDHGADLSFLTNALVTGSMKAGLRNEFSLRGVTVRQALFTPELGLIAFECGAADGMTINEGLILEIVARGSEAPLADGAMGEIVVSRINPDFPLIRFGTGLFASILPQPSTCGRTNMRISVPRSAADGCDGHKALLEEIARRHPNLRMRLVRQNSSDRNVLHLTVEHPAEEHALKESLKATLSSVTPLRGIVEFVAPGTIKDEPVALDGESPPS